MNRLLIILSFIFLNLSLKGQETLWLQTDRTLYLCEEQIQFYCWVDGNNDKSKAPVYVQLLDGNGEAVAKCIVENFGNDVSGELQIPNEIASGRYILHAETNIMKNGKDFNGNYKIVQIVNPARSVNYKELDETQELTQVKNTDQLIVELDTIALKQRERSFLEILPSNIVTERPVRYCVSITPRGLQTVVPSEYKLRSVKSEGIYVNEQGNVTLSGFVKEPNLSPETINISFFQKGFGSYSITTQKKHNFSIDLPYIYGKSDAYINASDSNLSIVVLPQFRQVKVQMKQGLTLSSTQAKILEKAKHNAIVYGSYHKTKSVNNELKAEFYGKPDLSIKLDDYVALSDVEEYLFELLPSVSLKKDDGKTGLFFNNPPYSSSFYEPLILLDRIRMRNVDDILGIDTEELDYIDVVPHNFRLGNQTYRGILSFFSKNADLAKVDLSGNGSFVNFNFFDNTIRRNNFGESDIRNLKKPLYSNSLFWKSGLSIKDKARVEFYTGDMSGDFDVVVTGICSDGREVEGRTSFRVE